MRKLIIAVAVALGVLLLIPTAALATITPPPGSTDGGITATDEMVAGYHASSSANGGITSATATWTQPAVTLPAGGSIYSEASFWVLLEGHGIGTVARVDSGTTYEVTVWDNDIWADLGTIKAGDVVTANVGALLTPSVGGAS